MRNRDLKDVINPRNRKVITIEQIYSEPRKTNPFSNEASTALQTRSKYDGLDMSPIKKGYLDQLDQALSDLEQAKDREVQYLKEIARLTQQLTKKVTPQESYATFNMQDSIEKIGELN